MSLQKRYKDNEANSIYSLKGDGSMHDTESFNSDFYEEEKYDENKK